MITRELLEQEEDRRLAPYAQKSSLTRGREHPEDEHEYRTVYQRDRDRIVHSEAFRKLEYKTQVFVNHEGDNFRTRLTHSMEVSQIARNIARGLRLNEDITEAVALAHDLGHTPFGHAGEDALNEALDEYRKWLQARSAEIQAELQAAQHHPKRTDHLKKELAMIEERAPEVSSLRFEHNAHSLRIVEKLEYKYPEFRGLNLSYEVRESIVKHETKHDKAPDDILKRFDMSKRPLMEAQIVDYADSIAYDNHDIEDSINMGIREEKDFESLQLWQYAVQQVKQRYPNANSHLRVLQTIKFLINYEVTDLIYNTRERVQELGIKSLDDVRNCGEKIVQFSPEMARMRSEFQQYMYDNVYRHFKVARMARKARRFVMELFAELGTYDGVALLPRRYQEWVREVGVIGICDYIAGMTDRQAQDEYKKLFHPYERV